MRGDHSGDDDDESAGRPADLHPRAAQRRDQEAGDDRRNQPLARAGAAGDAERHGERQRDDGDGEAGDEVGAKRAAP